MRFRFIGALAAPLCLAAIVVATGASAAAQGPPSVAAGPAFGYVPSQNANQAPASSGGGGHYFALQWHNGPVMHSTAVQPIFWGTKWSDSTFAR